ncbi:MAG: MazG family protein [Eubacterium sp.]|nr:MazG family protein [Eubacterium sp.]MCM1216656.1 MazG family protein [Lachnospiraceae bacterium]MCM1240420.1 MazG family protein [Lachnospiraceae bacterium]
MDQRNYTYEDFVEIIKKLRSENGCPWDREQTHMSLRPCMMEEAAEVAAAIRIYDRTGSYENLREELGDVLLQVVMHACIAEEEGLFTLEDVVSEVAEKMVRRHPHVFGDVSAETSGQALRNWEEIKKQEKEGKKQTETPLREIPMELPALTRAPKVLKKADRLYEPQKSYADSAEKLQEIAEKISGMTPTDHSEELSALTGELLMEMSNISRICRLSQEQILTDKIEGIIEKYEKSPKI